MSKYFCYGVAYAKFRETMEKEKELFLKYWSPENTKLLIEFTENQFRADCVYNSHNIANSFLETSIEGWPLMVTGLNFDYKRPVKEMEDIGIDWIENIQNQKLKTNLESLTEKELFVLTNITLNHKTRIEISKDLCESRQTTSKIYNDLLAELQALDLSEDD